FAHVNWFQRDPKDGHFLWNGFRDNVRALLWLQQYQAGEVEGVESPVGILPKAEELNLEGMSFRDGDLEKLLSIDVERWRQEMGFREEHLKQFRLPEEIWEAHRRVAKALDEAAG
ncbi:MAG: phosphoenolpyruvate carboxykinase domain-containing protein, partial [Nocardioides sp.]